MPPVSGALLRSQGDRHVAVHEALRVHDLGGAARGGRALPKNQSHPAPAPTAGPLQDESIEVPRSPDLYIPTRKICHARGHSDFVLIWRFVYRGLGNQGLGNIGFVRDTSSTQWFFGRALFPPSALDEPARAALTGCIADTRGRGGRPGSPRPTIGRGQTRRFHECAQEWHVHGSELYISITIIIRRRRKQKI